MDNIGFSTNSLIEKKYKNSRKYYSKSKLSLLSKINYFNSIHPSKVIEICFDTYTELINTRFNTRLINALSKYENVFIVAPWKNNFEYNHDIKTKEVLNKLKDLTQKINNFDGVIVIKSNCIKDTNVLNEYNLPIAIENNYFEEKKDDYLAKFEIFAKKYKIVFNLQKAYEYNNNYYFAKDLLAIIETNLAYVKPNSYGFIKKYYATKQELYFLVDNAPNIYADFINFFTVPLIIDFKFSKNNKIDNIKKDIKSTHRLLRFKPQNYKPKTYYIKKYNKIKKIDTKLKLIRGTFSDIDNRQHSITLIELLALEAKSTNDYIIIIYEILYLFRNPDYANIYINNAFELAKNFKDIYSIVRVLINEFLPLDLEYYFKAKFFLNEAIRYTSYQTEEICKLIELINSSDVLNESNWIIKEVNSKWENLGHFSALRSEEIEDKIKLINCIKRLQTDNKVSKLRVEFYKRSANDKISKEWKKNNYLSISKRDKQKWIFNKYKELFKVASSEDDFIYILSEISIPNTYSCKELEHILISKVKLIDDIYVYVNLVKALIRSNKCVDFANLHSVLMKQKANTFSKTLFLAREYTMFFQNKALSIEMLIKAGNNINTISDIITWVNYVKLRDKDEIRKFYTKQINTAFSKIDLLSDFYKINSLTEIRLISNFDINRIYNQDYNYQDYLDFITVYKSEVAITDVFQLLFLKNLAIKTKKKFKIKKSTFLDSIIDLKESDIGNKL